MQKISHYNNLIHKAREQDGENVPVIPLFFKMLYWILKNRGRFISFLFLGLHKKGNRINDYVSEKEYIRIHNQLNPSYYMSILEDKYVCDRFLKSFGFPIAESLGLLENGKITWITERITEPVENILHRDIHCYCKMITGWGGSKVYKLEVQDGIMMINNKVSQVEELISLTKTGIFILQKILIQHSSISRLNPSCVNTLRIITVHDGREIHKIGSFLRIGIGNSHVDNISSGNIACGIHDDGTLFSVATDAYLEMGWLSTHPTTGIPFASVTIPYYKEAVELTKQMHKAFHCFFIIAWDIAITATGPVAIEGNPPADIIWIQAYRGGLKKEFLQYASGYREARKTNL